MTSMNASLRVTLRRMGPRTPTIISDATSKPFFHRRHVSSTPPPSDHHHHHHDLTYIQQHYRIHRRGQDGHGSREYLLLPPHVTSVEEVQLDPSLPAAALFAHRNVLFGARSFVHNGGGGGLEPCGPLVQRAVEEAEGYGEQPQGMAALHGLCEWVTSHLASSSDNEDRPSSGPTTLRRLQERDDDPTPLEAVRAVATGVPRPGHSVVGQGTFRDAREAWQALAKEYVELGLGDEANLYRRHGGRLVAIEHLADTSPEYLKSAGGAMARFFFF